MAGDIDGPTVRLGADASAVDTELSKVSGKFEQFANQADQSFSNIGKNFSLSNVSQQLDALSSKMRNIGSTLTLAALPFEAIGGMAVKAYSDFEQNIGKINTLLPDATKEQMQGISSELKEFSAQYGADINASTQAYYDALSAGIEQIDVMPFMEAAQKAGVAGMSDVSVAVDGLTSVMNAYQMETERATEVSDVMFKTVELGKIEFDQLANTIGKVTPTASSFGVSFQDVGAAISQITSLGVSPEETMTGLKNLIKDLGTEGSDLNKKFRELSGQGFSEFIASGGSLVDVVGMLRDYSEQTGTSFFNMTGSFEAANTLAMLGGDAFENYAGFLGKIEESAGATGKAYEAMAGTMKFSMDQLQAQTQTMMIDIGEALAPSVQEFTKWLSENSDEIRDFAVSIAETAVPALETLFDILTGLMDAFNGLPSEARGLLAAALGVGIGGAALGGPLLMGAGMALGPLSTMVSLLGSLVVPATVATEIGAIGTAAGVAAGSGGVGALATAIAALGGGPVVLALAGVTLGIAAWETDFMGVRTTVLGAAQDAFNGFQEAVNQGINVASSGGASVGKSFYEGIQSLTGFDLSGMIAPLDAVISQAQERARTGGAEAAQAYIREWNDAVASGELKVPNVPGSETPSRSITMENNPVDIDWNEINRQKGYLENVDAYTKNLTFVGVGNLTATDANALEYQQSIEKVNQSFSGLPGKIQEAVQQGAKDGITDASSQPQPDAVTGKTSGFDEFKAYKNSGLSDRDKYTDESLHKLYDSNTNLITKYEAQKSTQETTNKAIESGTQAVNQFSQAVTTASEAAVDATTAQLAAESKGGGDSYDLFSGDPAAYLENELRKDLDTFYEGSLNNLIQDYQNHGKTLQDKLHAIYQEGKYDSGYGGNESDWMAKASPALNSFNTSASDFSSIIGDGNVKLSEAAQYLNQYNQESGQQIQYSQQQIGQSHEMLSAIMQISAAQSAYSQYMSDGSLSTQEAADMNSRLAEINRLLGDAGVTATGGVEGLPSALQSLASYASSAIQTINNAITQANATIQSAQYKVQSLNWKPDGPGERMPNAETTINQNINLQNSRFTRDYDPQKVIKDAFGAIGARG